MFDATSLVEYLRKRDIPYVEHFHPTAFTAPETAAAEHVSGKLFAKTVVVKSGERAILAVLPAHLQVDLDKLARLCGGERPRLASEEELAELFPASELGAMPPFGHLYGLDVYIDDDIAVVPQVTFNACSHRRTITVAGKDFLKAAEGVVADLSKDPVPAAW